MKQIKFVYFDLGGVCVLDYFKTNKFQKFMDSIGVDQKKQSEFKTLFAEYEPKICAGMTMDAFYNMAINSYKLTVRNGDEMLDDMISRFEINPAIQLIIDTASKKYPIGLLTNMYPDMYKKITKKGIMPNALWKIIIDSSIVGYAKPDPEIYKIAQQKAGFSANEILFIDNVERNCIAAEKLGWNTVLYDAQTTVFVPE